MSLKNQHQEKYEVTPVQSSNIAGIGYIESSRTLIVEFKPRRDKPGRKYTYNPVTLSTYQELMKAESHGEYLHQHIIKNELITCNEITPHKEN